MGKKVEVRLKNHEFLFGCGAFDVLAYTNAETENDKLRFADHTEKWEAVFNYGTLHFYWGTYEPQEGNVLQDKRIGCVNRLYEKGIKATPRKDRTTALPLLRLLSAISIKPAEKTCKYICVNTLRY